MNSKSDRVCSDLYDILEGNGNKRYPEEYDYYVKICFRCGKIASPTI